MKNLWALGLAVLLVVVTGGMALAYETDFDDLNRFDRSLPAWKLGRGVVNFFSGPYEFFTNIANSSIDGAYYGAYDGGLQGSLAGSANGAIAGSIAGTTLAAKRMTVGLLEILTFWKPEYGPTMDPEYGTRFRGEPFFFQENPFWYAGPPR